MMGKTEMVSAVMERARDGERGIWSEREMERGGDGVSERLRE